MAYTEDSVRAKLSALNETQESIVTVAQWVMFHRRHSGTTAQIWLQRLKDSGAAKRLNLIYLANGDYHVVFSTQAVELTVVGRGRSTIESAQER
ncbi:hypothetical protein LTR60_001134 [Cryomyces antarcticus]|nr:hypothetical protein LTR60_001134 [Cryomyces antarcticus]